MNILLIPDSFKGSISATEVIQQLTSGFSEIERNNTIQSCVASDGGEGFLDFVKKYVEVTMIPVHTVDPLGRDMVAEYAFAKATQTAYIELAKASGHELLSPSELNPLKTSTYGTGLQLQHAISSGATTIYVGLGGSATNDGGIGMAAALGYTFLDKGGCDLPPNGESLSKIYQIKKPETRSLPKVYAVNDVDNILTGETGAARTYAAQKGATLEQIELLDRGLANLAQRVSRDLDKDSATLLGAGAAGGSAYGLNVFYKASFIPGVSFLSKLTGIEEHLENGQIDLIITGEGSIDRQTLRGKLVKGVAQLGKKYDIPVIGICGVNQLGKDGERVLGLKKVFSVSDLALSKEDSIANASFYIKKLARSIYDFQSL